MKWYKHFFYSILYSAVNYFEITLNYTIIYEIIYIES